jgi:hypothetical protein
MLPGRISLFSLSFLVRGFQDPAHCARSSILVLGITRYTLLVFPFPLYMYTVLLGRVFDQKGGRGKEAYWRK